MLEVLQEFQRVAKNPPKVISLYVVHSSFYLELMREYVLPYILKLRDHCGSEAVVKNWWGESYVEPE